ARARARIIEAQHRQATPFGECVERKRFCALHVRGVARQEDKRRIAAVPNAIGNRTSANFDICELVLAHESGALAEEQTRMKYRKLGDSDLEVSEISLGSWLTYGVGVEADAARACFAEAFAQGINFVDTANVHGRRAARR